MCKKVKSDNSAVQKKLYKRNHNKILLKILSDTKLLYYLCFFSDIKDYGQLIMLLHTQITY